MKKLLFKYLLLFLIIFSAVSFIYPKKVLAQICGGAVRCEEQGQECKCSGGFQDGENCNLDSDCNLGSCKCSAVIIETVTNSCDYYNLSSGPYCGTSCNPGWVQIYNTCGFSNPTDPTPGGCDAACSVNSDCESELSCSAGICGGISCSPDTGGGDSCNRSCDDGCPGGWICANETNKCWKEGECGGASAFSCDASLLTDNITGEQWDDSSGNFDFCGPLTNNWTWTIHTGALMDWTKFDVVGVGVVSEHGDSSPYTVTINPNSWIAYGTQRLLKGRTYNNSDHDIGADCKTFYATNTCANRDSECIDYNFPSTMYAGDTESVSVSMKNAGSETWTPTWTTTPDYANIPGRIRLGSQVAQDNTTWGTGRVVMTDGSSIPLASSYTFDFNITAPSTVGTYSSKWGVLKEGVEWFGDNCGPDTITVQPNCPTNLNLTCTDSSTIEATWDSAPSGVDNYNISVNSDYTNNSQCLGSDGTTPVGWFCGSEGDEFLVEGDSNSGSGSEANSRTITGITAGSAYNIGIQSVATGISGCNIETQITCQTVTGNFYEGEGTPSGLFGYCALDSATQQGPAGDATLTTTPSTTASINYGSSTYALSVGSTGTYDVVYDPGTHPTSGHEYIVECPADGTYYNVSPGDTNVDFFVIDVDLSHDAWWQSIGGLTYGATSTISDIPDTCTLPTCNPFLITQENDLSPAEESAGIPLTGASSMSSGLGDLTDRAVNNQARAFSTTHENMIQENYAHFAREVDLSSAELISGTRTSIPSSATPDTDNTEIYYADNSIIIDFDTTQEVDSNRKIIILVDGDINFSSAADTNMIDVEPGSFIAFIASGNITFEETVGNAMSYPAGGLSTPNIEGVFVADGTINFNGYSDLSPAQDDVADNKFIGEGTFVGWSGINFNREYQNDDNSIDTAINNENPTEIFSFRPDFNENIPNIMMQPSIVWQEVN